MNVILNLFISVDYRPDWYYANAKHKTFRQ